MPEIPLPINGITDATPFSATPAGMAQPGGMVNFVPSEPGTNRGRISKRYGLRKLFPQRLGKDGNRRIRVLRAISRASAVTGYSLGQSTPLTIDNAAGKTATLLSMNVGIVATDSHTLLDAAKVYASGVLRAGAEAAQTLSTGVAGLTTTATWCDVSPDGTLAVFAFACSSGSQNRTLMVFIDLARGDVVGSKIIAPSGEDTSSQNNVATTGHCWTGNALWIGRGTQMWYVRTPQWGGRTRLYDPTTTAALLASVDFDLSGPASKITALATYESDGDWSIYAAFEGSTGAGYTANPTGAITSGATARHFRAGVCRMAESVSGMTCSLTVDTSFSLTPSVNAPFTETDSTQTTPVTHNSMRFSQWLARAPRGALPTGIAAASDGSFAVCFTNQGYGPTSSYLPNGAVAYTTVAKFDATGVLMWEADTQSAIAGEQGGYSSVTATEYACDVPDETGGGNAGTTNKDGPAVRAIAMRANGDVVVGGRINAGLHSVFYFGSDSGQLRWTIGLEGNRSHAVAYTAPTAGGGHGVPRGGLCISADDESVVAVHTRNNTFQSDAFVSANTERPYAVMWNLSAADGATNWTFAATQDTGTETSPTCCAAASGRVAYGCAAFTDS